MVELFKILFFGSLSVKYSDGKNVVGSREEELVGWDSQTKLKTHATTLANISGSKGLAGGQSLDLLYEKRKVTENEILKMHYLKTARLFEFCICAPLIMDKANTKQIKEQTLQSPS